MIKVTSFAPSDAHFSDSAGEPVLLKQGVNEFESLPVELLTQFRAMAESGQCLVEVLSAPAVKSVSEYPPKSEKR